MTVAVRMPVPIPCGLCGGRLFVVHVPMRTEAVDGWLRVAVDDEYLTAAVRVHARQHQN